MYCACGCGQITNIAKQNHHDRGIKKGDHYKVVRGHGISIGAPKRFVVHNTYVMAKASGHPKANARGYVYEHILAAEKVLGHYLPDGACVHHVDEDGTNNASSNLVICQDHAYHKWIHLRATAFAATGDAHARKCSWCGQWLTSDQQVVRRDRHNRIKTYHHGCQAYKR
jgi:HNH endonuclease